MGPFSPERWAANCDQAGAVVATLVPQVALDSSLERACDRSGPRAWAVDDLLGPLTAIERKFAPDALYVVGEAGLLRSGRRVAVVGSRKAPIDFLRRTRKLVRALVKERVTVVSGLAAGVDTIAHRTAIEEGGRTIAVLGTPIDVAYPSQNRVLQRKIGEKDALVSQFRTGTPVRRWNFPMRNRTIALISDAAVIVHAGSRSGTRHLGWEAIRLGRKLSLLESFDRIGIRWAKDLRRHGADVLSDASLDRWLGHLHPRVALNNGI